MDAKKIGEIQESISSVAEKIREVPTEDFSHIFEEELMKISSENSKGTGRISDLRKIEGEDHRKKVVSSDTTEKLKEGGEHITESVNMGDDVMLFVEGLEARRIIYEGDNVKSDDAKSNEDV